VLQTNTTVKQLNLAGTGMGVVGLDHVIQMLHVNHNILELVNSPVVADQGFDFRRGVDFVNEGWGYKILESVAS